jgi:hypothetical protein
MGESNFKISRRRGALDDALKHIIHWSMVWLLPLPCRRSRSTQGVAISKDQHFLRQSVWRWKGRCEIEAVTPEHAVGESPLLLTFCT